MNTIRELADDGYAVLIAEHRLDVVMPYADAVWSINRGRILRIDDKEQYLS
ncbi:MAG: hypothetical protein IJR55_07645 [Clostridia bacterium]|nr:hypothetical protein [Clostridia bacterium]